MQELLQIVESKLHGSYANEHSVYIGTLWQAIKN